MRRVQIQIPLLNLSLKEILDFYLFSMWTPGLIFFFFFFLIWRQRKFSVTFPVETFSFFLFFPVFEKAGRPERTTNNFFLIFN